MSSIVRSACWDLAGTDASTASKTPAACRALPRSSPSPLLSRPAVGRAGAFYGPCCPYSRTCRLYRNARLCHLPQSPCGTDRADRRVALQGTVLAAVDCRRGLDRLGLCALSRDRLDRYLV